MDPGLEVTLEGLLTVVMFLLGILTRPKVELWFKKRNSELVINEKKQVEEIESHTELIRAIAQLADSNQELAESNKALAAQSTDFSRLEALFESLVEVSITREESEGQLLIAFEGFKKQVIRGQENHTLDHIGLKKGLDDLAYLVLEFEEYVLSGATLEASLPQPSSSSGGARASQRAGVRRKRRSQSSPSSKRAAGG